MKRLALILVGALFSSGCLFWMRASKPTTNPLKLLTRELCAPSSQSDRERTLRLSTAVISGKDAFACLQEAFDSIQSISPQSVDADKLAEQTIWALAERILNDTPDAPALKIAESILSRSCAATAPTVVRANACLALWRIHPHPLNTSERVKSFEALIETAVMPPAGPAFVADLKKRRESLHPLAKETISLAGSELLRSFWANPSLIEVPPLPPTPLGPSLQHVVFLEILGTYPGLLDQIALEEFVAWRMKLSRLIAATPAQPAPGAIVTNDLPDMNFVASSTLCAARADCKSYTHTGNGVIGQHNEHEWKPDTGGTTSHAWSHVGFKTHHQPGWTGAVIETSTWARGGRRNGSLTVSSEDGTSSATISVSGALTIPACAVGADCTNTLLASFRPSETSARVVASVKQGPQVTQLSPFREMLLDRSLGPIEINLNTTASRSHVGACCAPDPDHVTVFLEVFTPRASLPFDQQPPPPTQGSFPGAADATMKDANTVRLPEQDYQFQLPQVAFIYPGNYRPYGETLRFTRFPLSDLPRRSMGLYLRLVASQFLLDNAVPFKLTAAEIAGINDATHWLSARARALYLPSVTAARDDRQRLLTALKTPLVDKAIQHLLKGRTLTTLPNVQTISALRKAFDSRPDFANTALGKAMQSTEEAIARDDVLTALTALIAARSELRAVIAQIARELDHLTLELAQLR